MRDDIPLQLKSRVGGIVGRGPVLAAVLVPAVRDVRGAQAAHRLHLDEEVVQHVTPVAQHVEDDAAAILLAVVPGGALRGNPVAFEHPIAELAAHREDLAEEAGVAQLAQLEQPGQPQLVLHHAVLDARLLRRGMERLGLGERGRYRLLAVDMLARGDGALEQRRAQLRGRRIEEDFVLRIESFLEVGGPALHAMLSRQLLELRGVATHQDGIGHDARAVLQRHAALPADLEDRADEVLVHAHAPGDAVHDDADALLLHVVLTSMSSMVMPSQSRKYTTLRPLFGPWSMATGGEIGLTP